MNLKSREKQEKQEKKSLLCTPKWGILGIYYVSKNIRWIYMARTNSKMIWCQPPSAQADGLRVQGLKE
jgi:hypothetical protein